ncbi:DNA mismatch repair endonuclease MutH [Aliidiomarina iranensis]|uniref:DNA mismatch repair protein MutH n=1 Tax=Aliidiomarina iranensis TaxID=1434071 RepID=A0A432W3E9_9GAMM|nr:DNA mismatch repair endonuclease MutH [Aliidiomarina iranensis]RUO23693.1 DNA mismatch repair endonuclease MutH [Aliidiomarina iranensis]
MNKQSAATLASAPPATEKELLARAEQLIGCSFQQLADIAGVAVPSSMRHAKGWAGQLLELFLGASAGSRAEQDFPEIGVELKTIPVNLQAMPLETTYVCIAPLTGLTGVSWEQSNVRNKLSKVLWIPIDGRREVPIGERSVGLPLLWQPSPTQEQMLKQDWEEITEAIVLGQVESITARTGMALQLRPKAANSKALTSAIGPHGELIQTLPRGYYLKKQFTQQILAEGLGLELPQSQK